MIPKLVSRATTLARLGQRDPEKERYWRDTIARFRKSGLSKSQFCQNEGLKRTSFSNWERIIRLRDREASVAKRREIRIRRARSATTKRNKRNDFVEVHLNGNHQSSAQPKDAIEISCPSGLTVRLPAGLDTNSLLAVLNMLRR